MRLSSTLALLVLGALLSASCGKQPSATYGTAEATYEPPADCAPRQAAPFRDGKRRENFPSGGGRDYVLTTACVWQTGKDRYQTAHVNSIEAIGYYSTSIPVEDMPPIEMEIDRLPFDRAAAKKRVLSLTRVNQKVSLSRVTAGELPAGAEDCWRYRSSYQHKDVSAYPGVTFQVQAEGLYCVSWDPENHIENRMILDVSQQYAPSLGHQPMADFTVMAHGVLSSLRM